MKSNMTNFFAAKVGDLSPDKYVALVVNPLSRLFVFLKVTSRQSRTPRNIFLESWNLIWCQKAAPCRLFSSNWLCKTRNLFKSLLLSFFMGNVVKNISIGLEIQLIFKICKWSPKIHYLKPVFWDYINVGLWSLSCL